jgi:hypothetical protein
MNQSDLHERLSHLPIQANPAPLASNGCFVVRVQQVHLSIESQR